MSTTIKMMEQKILIVDTTFLDAFFRLELLERLILLYSRVLIPVSVEREFLSEKNNDLDDRFRFLTESYDRLKSLQKCTTFDKSEVDLITADKRLHAGEAEVMAQSGKLGREFYPPETLFSVIDDGRARKVALSKNLNLTGTLYILAWMSLHGYADYDESVKKLMSKDVRFKKTVINAAMQKARQDFQSGGI